MIGYETMPISTMHVRLSAMKPNDDVRNRGPQVRNRYEYWGTRDGIAQIVDMVSLPDMCMPT